MLEAYLQQEHGASCHHILITLQKEKFTAASALYTYFLTQHKKVTLFCSEEIDPRFSFLPWFEKVRLKRPRQYDCEIVIEADALELYSLFTKYELRLNAKMAMALYCGIYEAFEALQSEACDGMVFAALSSLIQKGASHALCVQQLHKRQPLFRMRLRARLFGAFRLIEDAKVALLPVNLDDLEATGSSYEELYSTARELLNIVHVQEVRIVALGEEDTILKIIKG